MTSKLRFLCLKIVGSPLRPPRFCLKPQGEHPEISDQFVRDPLCHGQFKYSLKSKNPIYFYFFVKQMEQQQHMMEQQQLMKDVAQKHRPGVSTDRISRLASPPSLSAEGLSSGHLHASTAMGTFQRLAWHLEAGWQGSNPVMWGGGGGGGGIGVLGWDAGVGGGGFKNSLTKPLPQDWGLNSWCGMFCLGSLWIGIVLLIQSS